MNRQPKDYKSRDLAGSNSIPSLLARQVKARGVEEPGSLKTDGLMQSAATTDHNSASSLSTLNRSTTSCDRSSATITHDSSNSTQDFTDTEQQHRQRLAMTEQFLFKALQLDQQR
eukprot:CAMPEP_0194037944 /NCGR_PEP_ID=MMETSP0009_2-20130614/10251_1 /TAXON_ID=210454 /ORGANISM="Grammatophora oceanica, Strain CCMP 410" /LENGTH=114 /DNA_ID=CAMNT_0038680295 /DNA_START=100 /DNA_END=444 /DNA_ORIENTATION=-